MPKLKACISRPEPIDTKWVAIKRIYSRWFRSFCWIILFFFVSNVIGEDAARAWSSAEPQNIIMPPPGTLMPASAVLSLPTLRGISIDPRNPFKIDFVVDSAGQSLTEKIGQEQVNLLVKYFLSFLTLPEEDLWVNLSPYEKDHIIPPDFETTNAGRDMLVGDYILKQLASSLTYPDHEIGKSFWKKVYSRARTEYGSTDIPVSTFNKVWVVPDRAVVYEENGSAFISESRLKVLTEEDYLSIEKNRNKQSAPSFRRQKIDRISSEIMREIIVPELEQEVNEGQYFAHLRQMYNSLILAIWFKKRYKEQLIGQVYVNRKKTSGIALSEKQIKEKIYAQYLKALKKGAYNYIKEEEDPVSNEMIPRKYFSGGFSLVDTAMRVAILPASAMRDRAGIFRRGFYHITVALKPLGISKSNLMSLAAGALMMMGGVHQANASTPLIAGQPQAALQNSATAPGTDVQKLKRFYDVVIGSRKIDLSYDKQGIAKLAQAVNFFENIQPGQPGYGSKKDVRIIWGVINDGTFQKAYAHGPMGTEAVGEDGGRKVTSGQYYSQERAKWIGAQERLKAAKNGLSEFFQMPASAPAPWVAPMLPAVPAASPDKPKVIAELVSLSPAAGAAASVPVVAKPDMTPPAVTAPTAVTPPTAETPQPQQANHPETQSPMFAMPELTAAIVTLPNVGPEPTNVASANDTHAKETASSTPGPAVAPVAPPVMSAKDQKSGGYAVSRTVAPVPKAGYLVSPAAKSKSLVDGFDPAKREYKKGEFVCFVLPQELKTLIEDLTTKLEISRKTLSEMKDLLALNQGDVTPLRFVAEQERYNELYRQLARAYQEKSAGMVIAPDDFTVTEGDILITNGQPVKEGQVLLNYLYKNIVTINFTLPAGASYLNGIKDATINEKPIERILNAVIALDPLQHNLQVSLEVRLTSAISQGQEAAFNAVFLLPKTNDPELNSIVGRERPAIIQVGEVKQYVIVNPATGMVVFLVREGQRVVTGDILAVVADENYIKELQSIDSEIKDIDYKLSLAKDPEGNWIIKREDLNKLNGTRAELAAKQNELRELINRMVVRAPNEGLVSWVGAHGSMVFGQDEPIVRIRTPWVEIGDSNNSILFDKQLDVSEHQHFIVQTLQGVRLPAEVRVVNRSPKSSTKELGQYQAVQLRVFDPQDILQSNLTARVILPRDSKEEQIINDAWTKAVEQEKSSPTAGSPPPPLPPGLEDFYKPAPSLFLQTNQTNTATNATTNTVTNTTTNTTLPVVAAPTNSQQVLTEESVFSDVSSNYLVTGPGTIEILKNRQAEGYPKAMALSIMGAAYEDNGKIHWAGGFAGAIGDSIKAGGAMGPAVGGTAASNLALWLFGDFTSLVTGKMQLQTAIASTNTVISVYKSQAEVNGKAREALDYLIDMGAAQEKIAQLTALKSEFEKARSGMAPGIPGAFSLVADQRALDLETKTIEDEILKLENEKASYKRGLNFLRGKSDTNSNVNLPSWSGQFPSIDEPTKTNMIAELLKGDQSPNPEIKAARADLAKKMLERKLAGLAQWPSLSAGDVNLSDGVKMSGADFPLSEPVDNQRTSTLNPGGNPGAQLSLPFPFLNQRLKEEENVMSLRGKSSVLNVRITEATKVQELEQAVAGINSKSERIQQTRIALANAIEARKMKMDTEVHAAEEWGPESAEEIRLGEELADLKAQYRKERAKLDEIRGFKWQEEATPNNPEQSEFNFPTVAANSTARSVGALDFTIPDLPTDTNGRVLNPEGPAARVLAPGVIIVNVKVDPAGAWALMSASEGPLENIREIAINDPNGFVRHDALRHILNEYKNDPNFLPTAKWILLNCPPEHFDVAWDLGKSMIQQEKHGIRFWVQILQEAEANNNQALINLVYQSLDDIFTAHPEFLQKLAQSDFVADGPLYSQVSPENADRVFFTYIAREGSNSIGKISLLRSDYYGPDDLADRYNRLTLYVNTHPGEAGLDKITHLAKLIHETLLQKEALDNIDKTFSPGAFEGLGKGALDRDVISAEKIKQDAEATRRHLAISSQNMQDFIHPNLWARASQAATNAILNNATDSLTAPPLYSVSGLPSGNDKEFAYFKSLGLDGQAEYISELIKAKNKPALARMLDLPPADFRTPSGDQTPLRGVILDYLMEDAIGRVLVLRIYIDSSDITLLKLIEQRSWIDTLGVDIEAAKDPVSNDIYRSALEKLHDRTQANSFQNLRLLTISDLELHSAASDPRWAPYIAAQIKLVAEKRALTDFDESTHHRLTWHAGQGAKTASEELLEKDLNHILDNSRGMDPAKVNALFDDQVRRADHADKVLGAIPYHSLHRPLLSHFGFGGMVDFIQNATDVNVKGIGNNDQRIPKFPALFIYKAATLGLAILASSLSFFGLIAHHKAWRRKASAKTLIGNVYHQLFGGDAKKSDSAMVVIPPPNAVFDEEEDKNILAIFGKWHSLISNWDQQENLPAETMIDDLNTVLRNAGEALKQTPYTLNLVDGKAPPNRIYKDTFSYFNMIANNTLFILERRLQSEKLTDTQKKRLALSADALLKYIDYSSIFLRILSYRGSIDKVMSYKFRKDGSWYEILIERSGLYPSIRWTLLYQLLWKESERKLKEELPILLDKGNLLFPGFYENPPELISKSWVKLQTVTDEAKTLYDSMARHESMQHKMRSFSGRLLTFAGLIAFLGSLGALFLGVSWLSLGTVSFWGAIIIGFTLWNFWLRHINILRMEWNSDMIFLVNKLKKELEGMLNLSEINQTEGLDQQVVSLAREEGREQIAAELNMAHAPQVDMIVIVSQDPKNNGKLEDYVKSRRRKLIRDDIPVAVMSSSHQGSGNAYLDALLQVRSNFERYKQKYPHLKSWEGSQVVFIFHGTDVSLDDSIQYSLLDWGITNGYRAVRNGTLPNSEKGQGEEHRSGHTIIYTRDAYFGHIPKFPKLGITLLTSRVRSDLLKETGLVNADFTSTNQPEVAELLEYLDVEDLLKTHGEMPHGENLAKFLRERFIPGNRSLAQYPVSNGIFLIGPDAADIFTKIAEDVEKKNSWGEIRRNFAADLLIPMIIKDFKRTMNYAMKRASWRDMGVHGDGNGARIGELTPIQSRLQVFYESLNRIGSSIKANAYVPYSGSEALFHIAGTASKAQADGFKKVWGSTDAAMQSLLPGGVDLSGTRDVVQFNQGNNGPSAQSNIPPAGPAVTSLELFKGFEFQVTEFQPISNPLELLLGSAEKGGTLFSSRARSTNRHQA